VLPRRRPGAELLAVVAHCADPLAGLRGVVPEIADDVLDLAEGDPVAEPLLRAEDGEQAALVVGGVGAPVALLGDRGGPEVVVVDDRPAVAGGRQGGRQVRLPDPLGQPGTARPTPADPLDLGGHPLELADPVALGQRGEDRLVVAAAEELHLAPRHEGAKPLQELGALRAQPVEEGTGVVQGDPDAGMPLQGVDHRPIGLVVDVREDPPEVADGLVVVEREGERDARGHETSLGWWARPPPQPASVTTRRRAAAAATSTPAAGR